MAAMAPGIVQLSIFGWNQNLTKYVKDGQPEKAMQLFHQMQHEAMSPDKFTFVQGIGTCEMRARAEGTGTISTNATGGYAKCGALRMLGVCSTRCHLKMWSLGMPYLGDVPCLGMARKL
jgi:pentatricopeptide repeat protein